MHHVTVIFGLILTGLGLFAYFGSASADPSVTALIPAFVGAPLLLCGLLAHQEKWRMHAMHFAAMLGLIGAIAALGRVVMKLSTLITDDPTVDKRPVRIVLAMALFCIIFEVLCVNSFVQARRRRRAQAASIPAK